MHHQHGLSHLVRRQRLRTDEEDDDEGVETVVSVVFKTMPKTFTGDAVWVTQEQEVQTLIAPAVRTQTSDDDDETTTTKPRATPTPSRQRTSEAEETTRAAATSSPRRVASTIMVETSSPTVSGTFLAGAATGLASVSSVASTPSSTAGAEEASTGMSTGAKAGLALGLLIGIALILGGVLFMYNRKKKQNAQEKMDNEKMAMQNAAPPPPPPPMVVEPAPSIRTQRTMSTAPRLSLRPVTQFSPTFGENRKSGGNLLNVAAAGAPSGKRTPSPERPSSSWERPGHSNASVPPSNPFNDPVARSESPPQNPFGNNAAIETPQTTAPNTPQTAKYPSAPNSHLNDFGNPAPAIAAAEAAPVAVAAAAAAAAPMINKEIPAPPSINPDGVPPSPAWTEDIPASPGPAPSGPLPIAGGAPGPGAPPGPNNVHRVQLDFKPSMSDELELIGGQLVRMLHEYDDGWALCTRMDRSQQGVVPRTCLSKHPVKPRTGPPRQQGPPGPRRGPPPQQMGRPMGPPMGPPMGHPGYAQQPRPLSPASGRQSPHPPVLSPANGRMSPGPRSMSPGPRSMSPSMSPPGGRARSHSNAPYAGPPRSMSPGPYGGGPQQMMPPPQMGRPRSNSAGQVQARRGPAPGPSPMNPNSALPMPSRKPVPGLAL